MTEVLQLAGIPVIAAVIGLTTNWLAVKMMFAPMRFIGIGPIGWQGVIPSKAAKMGSISTDTGISKVGTPREFFELLDRQAFAEHIVESTRDDIADMVERIARRELPEVWEALPAELRDEVHRRVQEELPDRVDEVTRSIEENIEHLLDLKLMIVNHLDRRPHLANRIFSDVGDEEFTFIVRSGGVLGFLLGLLQMVVWLVFAAWWMLPLAGLLVGWITNWIALRIIFSPVDPIWIGRRHKVQGLFLKRQDEVAEAYSRIVSEDILTIRNITHELLNGPSADRTRRLVEDGVRPSIDAALGWVAPVARLAVGTKEYDAVQESLARESVDRMLEPLADDQFNRERSAALQGIFAERMKELPSHEFAEMLRSAFREDEWQLIAVGSLLGGTAGALQLILVYGS